MRTEKLIASLEANAIAIPTMLVGISENDARWKPPSQNWSILEIICHLVDEEKEDFRLRVELTLSAPTRMWPSINPQLWALDRNYQARHLLDMVQQFEYERRRSVAWLKQLSSADWYATYEHPHLGPIRAGDLLAAWAAHDFLHIRQISKRRYEMIGHDAGDFSTQYAGEWSL